MASYLLSNVTVDTTVNKKVVTEYNISVKVVYKCADMKTKTHIKNRQSITMLIKLMNQITPKEVNVDTVHPTFSDTGVFMYVNMTMVNLLKGREKENLVKNIVSSIKKYKTEWGCPETVFEMIPKDKLTPKQKTPKAKEPEKIKMSDKITLYTDNYSESYIRETILDKLMLNEHQYKVDRYSSGVIATIPDRNLQEFSKYVKKAIPMANMPISFKVLYKCDDLQNKTHVKNRETIVMLKELMDSITGNNVFIESVHPKFYDSAVSMYVNTVVHTLLIGASRDTLAKEILMCIKNCKTEWGYADKLKVIEPEKLTDKEKADIKEFILEGKDFPSGLVDSFECIESCLKYLNIDWTAPMQPFEKKIIETPQEDMDTPTVQDSDVIQECKGFSDENQKELNDCLRKIVSAIDDILSDPHDDITNSQKDIGEICEDLIVVLDKKIKQQEKDGYLRKDDIIYTCDTIMYVFNTEFSKIINSEYPDSGYLGKNLLEEFCDYIEHLINTDIKAVEDKIIDVEEDTIEIEDYSSDSLESDFDDSYNTDYDSDYE